MLTEEEMLLRQQSFHKFMQRAKKRTCPRCGLVFLTRKGKRIHRRNVPECEPVKNPHTFKYA